MEQTGSFRKGLYSIKVLSPRKRVNLYGSCDSVPPKSPVKGNRVASDSSRIFCPTRVVRLAGRAGCGNAISVLGELRSFEKRFFYQTLDALTWIS